MFKKEQKTTRIGWNWPDWMRHGAVAWRPPGSLNTGHPVRFLQVRELRSIRIVGFSALLDAIPQAGEVGSVPFAHRAGDGREPNRNDGSLLQKPSLRFFRIAGGD